jgi:Ca-activated chloride channel family protein
MTQVIDEIMLTAYALGELSGAERAAVAAHLVSNADARQYVAEVRAAGNLLSDELARESFGGLTEQQHAVIEQELLDMVQTSAVTYPNNRAKRQPAYWNHAVFAMSLAASVAIVLGGMALLAPFIYVHVQTAIQSEHKDGAHVGTVTKPEIPPIQESANSPGIEVAANSSRTTPESDRVMADPIDSGEQSVPPPDDTVVDRGTGREEAPLIPPPQLNISKPPPLIPVARGPTIPGADDRGPSHTEAARPSAKPPENFATLPIGQQPPGKVNTAAAKSVDGLLSNDAKYAHVLESPLIVAAKEPFSGFSAGVDTASYSNIRRYLTHNIMPPRNAVRIEEMLNYFPVHSSTPTASDAPVALQVEIGTCPWAPERRLARVWVTASEFATSERPPVNLVFVIDVSERMKADKAKLALVKQAMQVLIGSLSPRDRIAFVAYGHEPGVVLAPTFAIDKTAIRAALSRLDSGGATPGGQGIGIAYDLASSDFMSDGLNRIVLISDGNWNIGTTDAGHLASAIRGHAGTHVSLTVMGVGIADFADATLQGLADAGNGSYAYVDTIAEAKKVLTDQMNGSLVAKASDVKVSVAFDPDAVLSYRMLGYERRALTKEQIKNHSRAGGEMGAGQSVTALYEIVPATRTPNPALNMVTASVNYIEPVSHTPHLLTAVGVDKGVTVPAASSEFRFAAAVAEFGLLLRDSDYKGNATYSKVIDYLDETARGDLSGYRQECLNLVRKARDLSATHPSIP